MTTINKSEILLLQETVIDGGYCIGCGACASVKNSPFKIKMNEYGCYVAYLPNVNDVYDESIKVLDVCPFSGKSKNEDQIGDIFFPNNIKNNQVGNYLKCYAGFVIEPRFRENGSSGGVGKWMGAVLLKENKIDYFIQVVAKSTSNTQEPLFDYQVFDTYSDVLNGSKSSYYPVNLEKVIAYIKDNKGRYAITGVPCFIKTLRLLMLSDNVIAERICYTFGIFCGGMKSANQAKMIGWQLGVEPDSLSGIDFRGKYTNKPANNKKYTVMSKKDNIERSSNESKIFGTDFGAAYFKPQACDYCDDIVGETADISLGDAWLPKYISDPKGTSMLIVRNITLLELIEKYNMKQVLHLEELKMEDVIKAQEGAYRHRREALSYRIAKKNSKLIWVPEKRVSANQFPITEKRKAIYSLREEIALESHEAFYAALQKNDFNLFLKRMKPIQEKYDYTLRGSHFRRVLRKLVNGLRILKIILVKN